MSTEGKVTYKYIVYIQFEESKKAYTFGSNVKYYTNDIVVVETVRGQELGKVCVPTVDFDASKVKGDIKPVLRKATPEDIKCKEENVERAKEAMKICHECVANLKLDMHLISSEYTLDRTKVIFTYVSDDRVDFRQLLKDLAQHLHCRIELRQVGPRNKAKIVGGIGNCGMECCCSRFMSDFDTVSINMAKNQLLALNIQKLRGQCGKLMCGLRFENEEYTRSMRIIADHIRAIVMIAGDNSGIKPSNKDQGYVLRRLIRRMIRHAKKLDIDISSNWDTELATLIIDEYKDYYKEIEKNKEAILEVISSEKVKFNRTLEKGLKEFEKVVANNNMKEIDKDTAFRLYDTFGFPIELTVELAKELNLTVDVDGFNKKFQEHQEKSRAGAEQKFKGGLASTGDMETKYHTATHLLNAALKRVLGNHVHQKGSNITAERLRFDFSHDAKMTDEEKQKVENLVNEYIKMAIPVEKLEMKKEDAIAMGAEAMFIEKYGDIVTVYKIGDVSLELCGGPHVKNTSELGKFKIKKEEASSAGVRRIKAILE